MSRLCLNTFAFSVLAGAAEPPDARVLIDAVAGSGFEALSVDVATVTAWREQGLGLPRLAAMLESAGLSCPEVLGCVVGDDEKATLAGARATAEVMGELGAGYALGMVTLPPGTRCRDLVAATAEIIADSGGKVAIECLPFTPIAAIEDARALVRHAGTARAGVLVDVWHFFHGPDGWPELEALPVEEIAYIQVNDHPVRLGPDADLMTACMTGRVMPGDGVLDLAGFADALSRKGYDGLFSVEVLSGTLAALGPAEFARRAHTAAKRFFG